MGNRRLYKIECLHMLGAQGSERLKVTALNLWDASRLSFDRPLPGKPPNIPDRLPPFKKSVFSYYDTASEGEGFKIMGRLEVDLWFIALPVSFLRKQESRTG